MSLEQIRTAQRDAAETAVTDDLKAKGLVTLSFGEKAVGLTFNPSGDRLVNVIKKDFAAVIDTMHSLRTASEDLEVKRMCSVAITEAQTAQMWAVKAATWKH